MGLAQAAVNCGLVAALARNELLSERSAAMIALSLRDGIPSRKLRVRNDGRLRYTIHFQKSIFICEIYV